MLNTSWVRNSVCARQRRPAARRRPGRRRRRGRRSGAEGGQHRDEVLARGGLRGGDADGVVVDEPQVHAALAGRVHDRGRAPGHPAPCTVSKNVLVQRPRRPAVAQRGGQHGGVPVGAPRDRRAAPRGRGRRRTSTRRRPAAPARCRCWRSPCRGGCAARGSAARAGTPAGPRRRPRRRPAGRAGAARGRRAPP